MEKTRVIYRGDRETYHPRLGPLVPDQPFELEEETANRYIKSGLLEKYKEAKKLTAHSSQGGSDEAHSSQEEEILL